jgi:hypothetical protein
MSKEAELLVRPETDSAVILNHLPRQMGGAGRKAVEVVLMRHVFSDLGELSFNDSYHRRPRCRCGVDDCAARRGCRGESTGWQDDPRLDLQAAALYLEALASTQAEVLASQHAVHTLMRRLHRSSRWLPGMRGLVRLSTADQLAQAAGWQFRS